MDFDHAYADYIDEKGLAELQAFEKESGKLILAYSSPPEPASLSDEQLSKLRELENKLCVRLVAYNHH